MRMATDEERIALFIDHENLVLGAREIGRSFDVGPIMEALAERGRVVARRAYADWTLFADDRRSLVEHNCELIDIPQRTGAVRKNAADIKLAVDAMELAYERGFVSTFVICSGDSDFTPLVAALRGLNRRVIGIGVKGSTSALLPPACDEFLFYDRLPGVSEPAQRPSKAANGGRARAPRPAPQGQQEAPADTRRNGGRDLQDVQRTLTQTLAGLKQSGTEPVLASTLKRAMLRKDPTFSWPSVRLPATRVSTSPTPASPRRRSRRCARPCWSSRARTTRCRCRASRTRSASACRTGPRRTCQGGRRQRRGEDGMGRRRGRLLPVRAGLRPSAGRDGHEGGGLRQLRSFGYRPSRQHPGSCGTSTRPTLWRKASTTCGPANWKVWR